MLIGNVGKEPDVRYYDTDQAVAQFPLATTERGYTLHNLVVWRGLAKVVEKHVHKGDKLYVEGRIRYRSYDDQKGQRRYVTEILVENMELLNPKPIEREENALQNAAQPTTAQPISSQQATEKQNTSPVDDTTDDNKTLPF